MYVGNFFYLIQEKKEANIKKKKLANPEQGYESLSSDYLSGLILLLSIFHSDHQGGIMSANCCRGLWPLISCI